MSTIQTFSDGSRLVEGTISLSEVPEGLEVRIEVVRAGAIFDDGTVTRVVTAEDFDENGLYRYRILVGPGIDGAACHSISFEQDGVRLN